MTTTIETIDQSTQINSNKKRRIEEKRDDTLAIRDRGEGRGKMRKSVRGRRTISSLVSLKPAPIKYEVVWAHVKGFPNWPGIIEEETPKGKYKIHFFGDYSTSDVGKNKIMHLLEGFN